MICVFDGSVKMGNKTELNRLKYDSFNKVVHWKS